MDPAVLRKAAKNASEVNSQIRAGAKAFPSETDRAAGALGSGWATAGAMERLSSDWLRALNRTADEVDYLGDAVEKCAGNRSWAEEEIQQRINRIRTGAH